MTKFQTGNKVERFANLTRMLAKGLNEGVRAIELYNEPGVFVVMSTGNRGAYRVQPRNIPNGCTCMGYQRHGYCKHYAVACATMRLDFPHPVICPGCGEWNVSLQQSGVCKTCEEIALEHEFESQREAEYVDQIDWDYINSLDEAGMTAG